MLGVAGILGNLRTTTKFTTTTSVDWERTGTRTSVSAGKRKLKMQSIGRSAPGTIAHGSIRLQPRGLASSRGCSSAITVSNYY